MPVGQFLREDLLVYSVPVAACSTTDVQTLGYRTDSRSWTFEQVYFNESTFVQSACWVRLFFFLSSEPIKAQTGFASVMQTMKRGLKISQMVKS